MTSLCLLRCCWSGSPLAFLALLLFVGIKLARAFGSQEFITSIGAGYTVFAEKN
jgi:hypothetical protein